jgi:PKD repeat protein
VTTSTPQTTHTYTSTGQQFNVTLTVTDNLGAQSTPASGTVGPLTDLAPTAAFTATPNGLTATFDGSGSSDPDGTVTSYAWDFGDGQTATTTTPQTSHAYATASTYTATLVVTDNLGATSNTASQSFTVSSTTVTPIATDAFGRTVTGGWGTADSGGAWATSPSASTSVGNGVGRMSGAAGATVQSWMSAISVQDVAVQADVSLESMPTGNGASAVMVTRRVSGSTQYQTVVHVSSTGVVTVQLGKKVNGTQTNFGSPVTLTGVTYTPGMVLEVLTDLSGSNQSAKVWVNGTTAPTAWTVTATDADPLLQVAGSIGMLEYVAGNSVASPLDVDNWWAGPSGSSRP